MTSEAWPWFQHAPLRTIVLHGKKLLFTPVPKSGCTSMLWLIADLAGYKPRRFHKGGGSEVTPHMTVHNLWTWGDKHRWSKLSATEQYDIGYSDKWLRFTVVRDPATRLWSAWQSKLLMQEPGFVERFGDEDWFPTAPVAADEVVQSFRAFVRSLDGADRPLDVHWAPQHHLLGTAPPMNYIGRAEAMGETLDRLAEHLEVPVDSLVLTRENSSLVSYHPGVYDDETRGILAEVYAGDYEAYGYQPVPEDSLPPEWFERTGSLLAPIHQLVDRHRRIDVLSRAASSS